MKPGEIQPSRTRREHLSIAGGLNSTILIAEDVVVDKFWRGKRLGPSLVLYAAELLRTDAIFLTPFGLHTRLNAQGECYTDYWTPRPGPEVQKKVKQAWRNAGFIKLCDGVVWSPTRLTDAPTDDKRLDKTLARFVALRDDADSARAKSWWWRRIARQADGPKTRT